jgi:hypothetical protein
MPASPGFWLTLIQSTGALPKALAKLVDTLGDQIGLFLEPGHTRRKGQALADVSVADAKARAEIATIDLQSRIALRDTADRADERVRRREVKRQANIEAIAAQAAKELPESVSEQPVDEDWIAQFLNYSQDVSNEQMQTIWARLLAGEVAKPGSFSLQTLALVRVLGKEDADSFTRLCSMTWHTPHDVTAIVPDAKPHYPGDLLNYLEFLRLDSIGLIQFMEQTHLAVHTNARRLEWYYFGHKHVFARPEHEEAPTGVQLMLSQVILTVPGRELVAVAGGSPNEAYREAVVAFLHGQGWQVRES